MNRARKFAAGIAVAVLASVGTVAVPDTSVTGEPVCVAVDYGTVSDARWYALRDNGWTGRAGDHAERLYAPDCPAD